MKRKWADTPCLQCYHKDIRSICVVSVRRRQKIQTRAREWMGTVKKRRGFGFWFRHIGVVLSQCLVCLRTKKLCSLFHGLFPNNEATREAAIE